MRLDKFALVEIDDDLCPFLLTFTNCLRLEIPWQEEGRVERMVGREVGKEVGNYGEVGKGLGVQQGTIKIKQDGRREGRGGGHRRNMRKVTEGCLQVCLFRTTDDTESLP